MNALIAVLYVIFAVIGSTLIKYGGIAKTSALFTVPIVSVSISAVTLFGIASYGVSFVLYILLLNKFDLSFISPLTVGIVYVLLMVTSIIVFNESFSVYKAIGCVLILAGVLMMLAHK